MSRTIALAAAVLGSALLAAAARMPLEPAALDVGRIRDPAWLPEGRAVRLVSMGQRQLLADVYWLKSVQYMGEMTLTRGDWRALYPLADLTTELDPRFGYAYQVAGSNLAGLAHRYDEADRILQKGMRNVPDRWSLPWTYGVNKFLYQQDFAAAAEHMRRAAELGKRPYLALLAANLSLVTDAETEYGAAETILVASIAQTETEGLRAQLEERLVKVRTYAVLSRVERAVAEYERRHGRRPFLLTDLIAAGLLPEIPADPSGGAVVYDPLTGTVASSVLGERAPFRVN